MKIINKIHIEKLNRLALLLFIIISFNSCNNKKIKNGWEEDKLKGKVKSYTQFSYEALERFGKIEKGALIKDIFANLQNNYDEVGNLIERNTFREGSIVDIEDKDTYKYDKKSNKVEAKSYSSDGSLSYKETFKYDENNNMIEHNGYSSDGSLSYKETFKYDENNNMIEQNNYSSDGILTSKETFKYDEKSNNIEANYYSSDGSLTYKFTFKYDENNNMIEKNGYSSDGRLDEKCAYKYDEMGNISEYLLYDSDGSIILKVTEKYDDKGNMKESCSDENKREYEYEYDNVGNWIKQIVYLNKKPIKIYERSYQYYK